MSFSATSPTFIHVNVAIMSSTNNNINPKTELANDEFCEGLINILETSPKDPLLYLEKQFHTFFPLNFFHSKLFN